MLRSTSSLTTRLLPATTVPSGRLAPALVALLVWGLSGFVVAFWVLRWLGQGPVTPLPVPVTAPVAVDSQAVARALGAPLVPTSTPMAAAGPSPLSRYVLTGVVAPASGASGSGVALVAVDGQRPTPYRVGAELDGRWRLHSVQRSGVVLQPLPAGSGPDVTLELPD